MPDVGLLFSVRGSYKVRVDKAVSVDRAGILDYCDGAVQAASGRQGCRSPGNFDLHGIWIGRQGGCFEVGGSLPYIEATLVSARENDDAV